MTGVRRAVIFDLDGVLADTEPSHFAALNRVLAEEGWILPPEANHELLGLTLERTWDVVIARFGLTRPVAEYHARYVPAVLAELARPFDPAPGARELIDVLVRAGVPIALASSSRRVWIDATLAAIGLTGRFPVIVSGEDVARGKPDPEIFQRAAQRLGVDPAGCVAIEDSPAGIAAARRAGMTVIAVQTPLTAGLTLAADRVVASLGDVDLQTLWPAPAG